jgi:hypothetical protein
VPSDPWTPVPEFDDFAIGPRAALGPTAGARTLDFPDLLRPVAPTDGLHPRLSPDFIVQPSE